ncbi:hypothetical protein PanWU01x14_319600 [Parasponia andersonii]|uniref:Generative cell specific-1/HAP2 domain-containing protein n=1 Tax=Parasponia andersonii TaxID=3476 RepID=A0A2P5AM68_PARAD|nr:hypothetical protein PanWU01x14_319600 [Parasponia andersonii]
MNMVTLWSIRSQSAALVGCSGECLGRGEMFEQFFIMKPKEETTRSFKLYPSSDQTTKYVCAAILKDSDYNEVDRAECQFATTLTVLDNGSQNGLFDPIHEWWEDHFSADNQSTTDARRHGTHVNHSHVYDNKHHKHELRHHKNGAQHKG